MGNPVIVDASFLVALWRKNDQNHPWAIQQAQLQPPPWITCESVLSEADHLLAPDGCATLRLACRRGALRIAPLHEDAFIPSSNPHRPGSAPLRDLCACGSKPSHLTNIHPWQHTG